MTEDLQKEYLSQKNGLRLRRTRVRGAIGDPEEGKFATSDLADKSCGGMEEVYPDNDGRVRVTRVRIYDDPSTVIKSVFNIFLIIILCIRVQIYYGMLDQLGPNIP